MWKRYPRIVRFSFISRLNSCHRKALLLMAKPTSLASQLPARRTKPRAHRFRWQPSHTRIVLMKIVADGGDAAGAADGAGIAFRIQNTRVRDQIRHQSRGVPNMAHRLDISPSFCPA